jgi:hypothetical protein
MFSVVLSLFFMKYWIGDIKCDLYSNPITAETYEDAHSQMLTMASNREENLGTLREVSEQQYLDEIDYIWKKRKGEI